ncbi:neutral/alkaline ceramidase [Micromonas commoda]|uniref:Neutral ceramidase n=1 Tax=Micromonas commoda (strain RCC299 / NOUM17 / CCMP2709) TaxID=296587 RepID=C1E4P9_MICCC|nr:neutral/alkaline ceramidase [Micromonas commoda]ACO63157.1 neutral/alkaline ceramidase [Micromonas commoda]|eukprot:XP_002501899.1 neutral/alkaline ceramidase [Micromonas commoda]
MPAAGGLTRGGRTGRASGRRLGKGNYAVKHRRFRLVEASASNPEEFIVGCGTGDVTGPIDGVGMMGYAKIGQVTRGMWQRQWARAFLVSSSSDSLDSSETVAVVVVDACMCFPNLKTAALRALAKTRGTHHPLTEANTCVCATHTHAAPGGFAPFGLYNVTTGGAVSVAFDAAVQGVAEALDAALDDAIGRPRCALSLTRATLAGAAVNRSTHAYRRNPASERAEVDSLGSGTEGVDETLTVLRMGEIRDGVDVHGGADGGADGGAEGALASLRGAVVWYAVHGTSLRNSFTLASGDNKGVASWLAETALAGSNDGDDVASSLARCRALIDAFGGGEVFDPSEDGVRLAVQAPSVAAAAVALESSSTRGSQKPRTGTGRRVVVAFPQGASGDVSPNVRGARRVNDPTRLCDEVTGAGDELKVTGCAGFGPAGADDAAGCVATGAAQAAAALKALTNYQGSKGGALEGSKGFRSLAGPVRHAYRWLPVGRGVSVDGRFTADGDVARTSSPAKGYSFAAGTTDGPGQDGFLQGITADDEDGDGGERGVVIERWKTAASLASWGLSGFGGGFEGAFGGVPGNVRESHRPKPVLLHFGDANEVARDHAQDAWVAVDVPVQVLRVGTLLVACVPAEVTTAAGARLVRWIKASAAEAAGTGRTDGDWEVIVTGLANGYSGYVTTPEEYAAQRYEGASTLYGPNTLGAYAMCLCELTRELLTANDSTANDSTANDSTANDSTANDSTANDDLTRSRSGSAPGSAANTPRDGIQARVPPVDLRWPPWRRFGDVLASNVTRDASGIRRVLTAGIDEASATFLCGRPRRHARPPPLGTYMTVERLRREDAQGQAEWEVVATDDDLSTRVEYRPAGPFGLSSELTLRWRPPENIPGGVYRVGVRGVARGVRKFIKRESPGEYEGYSERFLVEPRARE